MQRYLSGCMHLYLLNKTLKKTSMKLERRELQSPPSCLLRNLHLKGLFKQFHHSISESEILQETGTRWIPRHKVNSYRICTVCFTSPLTYYNGANLLLFSFISINKVKKTKKKNHCTVWTLKNGGISARALHNVEDLTKAIYLFKHHSSGFCLCPPPQSLH